MGSRPVFALVALLIGALASSGQPGASAQTLAPDFVEAASLCRDAMLARAPLAELPRASDALAAAPPEVRAAHPLGNARAVWVLVGRSDGDVTIVEEQPKRCSVFAVNTPPGEVFDAAGRMLTETGAFQEDEPTARRSGGVQRNFASTDRNVRVELQTFPADAASAPPADVLTMALFARRR